MPVTAKRIVPTGPESFAAELLTIDADFFGACPGCPDCEAGEGEHPIDEDDDDTIKPVLVVRR